MQRAIQLARHALGTTTPNPAVGAVVVKDSVILGSGHTQPPGGHHAEIEALQMAGEASCGATLYTTLEPCCVFGRTPPCTQAIINAGIQEVHLAAIDPNPKVSGKGRTELEAAGIQVATGEEAEAAGELYEAFAKHVNTGLPFVTAKFAMSLDGKIATKTGDSRWITGQESRREVHRMRRESDAVMVGVNTVLADDPQLTARDEDDLPLPKQPLRVVLDSQCRTSSEARMLREPGDTLIAVSGQAPHDRVDALKSAGAEVLLCSTDIDGRVALDELLKELGRRNVVSLMVEAGGTLQGALFDAGLVDKVCAFIAPIIIGGSQASSPVHGRGAAKMVETRRLGRTTIQQIGADWLVVGYPEVLN
ncbi:MAG: bifunctional diaminohydroxyphosphoribosylaminopyrimidine deaminase/5-amino-6-(5-phosphoribosylamino)uracil reductase RibD [Chloroflexi bacterium]|nr:bifunctional diaminohydroxyphosphoribosylaminopyrimidine deaminase/5-amino-6-(5-phosphoribosylamino)uracil reductase RibD [Chloroflexota bacterium]